MKKLIIALVSITLLACTKAEYYEDYYYHLWESESISTNGGDTWIPMDRLPEMYKCTLRLVPENKTFVSTGFLGDFAGSFRMQANRDVDLSVGGVYYMTVHVEEFYTSAVSAKITLMNGTEFWVKFNFK